MIPAPTRKASPCWSAPWVSTRPTHRRGRNLGRRYYLDSQYGGGGEAMFQKTNAALERALVLDPNLTIALRPERIATRVERGELVKAYQDAQALVRAPAEECDISLRAGLCASLRGTARRIGKGMRRCDRSGFRETTCSAHVRSPSARWETRSAAMEFIRLDAGSDFYNGNVIRILLREGKVDEARAALKDLPADDGRTRLLRSLLRPALDEPTDDSRNRIMLFASARRCWKPILIRRTDICSQPI